MAMESTDVYRVLRTQYKYWKPVFNVLEEDFEIMLVNARHVKNVPGHTCTERSGVRPTRKTVDG